MRTTYVLVKDYLSPAQVAVQACHAVQLLGHIYQPPERDTRMIILKGCPKDFDKFFMICLVNELAGGYAYFEKPLNDYTAVAVVVDDAHRHLFSRFSLYRGP